jgi:hypothetical protein
MPADQNTARWQPRIFPSREDSKVMSLHVFSLKAKLLVATQPTVVLEAFRTMAIEHHSCM